MNQNSKTPDLTEQLTELAKLHKDGALSDEEFGALKTKIIARAKTSQRISDPSASLRLDQQTKTSNSENSESSSPNQKTISDPKHLLKRNAVMAWVGVAVIVIILLAIIYSPRFSNADIEEMKTSIRVEFEKRVGVTVLQVEMLREGSTKAVGFVKLRVPYLGEITKACSATMAEASRYIWRCE